MADNKQEAAAPSIQVVTQYIKDISFENPHAPESLVSGWAAPETSVQISMNQKPLAVANGHETSIRFRIEAKNKQDSRMAFIIDLHYGAMVILNNVPKENVAPVLMVEVPKLLFPFVREMVASLTSQGGYPPLFLTPINFEAIYMAEMQRLKASGEKEKAAGGKK